ncbi:MAG: flippase activity-associated protein Agl23 [Chthoniobacterales bacterium]
MRIAAVTSSGAEAAPAVSPTLGSRLDGLLNRADTIDWTPWAIVALGAFLRLLLLGIKPPHFDEGINGWFVDQMVKSGFYRYDPTNYHGPLHFYILFLAQTLLGRNLWAIRLPVVLASIFAVHLTLKFEPFVGRNVSRIAALAMAVSPGFVFYGRYSIHEVWLLVFSMLFMLGVLGLWRRGSVGYLWCTGMGLTGMILTKETYIIHVGCAVIAAFVTWISHKITRLHDASRVRQTWTFVDLAVVAGTGAALIVFFYSGAFMNWSGVTGLFKTFQAWFQTGNKGNGHEKDAYSLFWPKSWINYYWFALLARYELPALIGLVLCAACQFYKHLALRYLAIYAVGALIAYTIISYKTPWCIISFAWPFLFLFAGAILLVPARFIRAASIGIGIALTISLGLCIRLNYFHFTTDTEPYVYVQSYKDIWKLTRPLLRLAKADPTKYQMVGHLIRGSTYPLPWMLGDFTRVGYYEGGNMPDKLDGDFLLVQEDKIATVEAKLHETYFTEPMTIRQYQDPSKLYLNVKTFQKLFPGRVPEFVGKPAP